MASLISENGRGRVTGGDDFLLHQSVKPVARTDSEDKKWFDRFYFNAQSPDCDLMIVIGGGVYPNVGVADGYCCVSDGRRQKNLRFTAKLTDRSSTEIGPLMWRPRDPLRAWDLHLSAADVGLELQLSWTAASEPYLVDPIEVHHPDGPPTSFAHFFQTGKHDGHVEVDGAHHEVRDWLGQRDRSWGVRRTREKLGMHLWLALDLRDRCLGLNYNEDRQGRPAHMDGASSTIGSAASRVTDVGHALEFDESGEVSGGKLFVQLEDGKTVTARIARLGSGVYMAGAGYDGRHGRGQLGVESEIWTIDDLTLSKMPLGLVDRACLFEVEGEIVPGLLELAISRSQSFTYAPRWL